MKGTHGRRGATGSLSSEEANNSPNLIYVEGDDIDKSAIFNNESPQTEMMNLNIQDGGSVGFPDGEVLLMTGRFEPPATAV